MYKTSLREVFRVVSREKAYRTQSEKAILDIVSAANISDKQRNKILKSYSKEIEKKTGKNMKLLIDDYNDFFMATWYKLFIKENFPKNLDTISQTEDYLVVEYIDCEFDCDFIYCEINIYKTLREVEEAILEIGTMDAIRNILVIEKGRVKDFQLVVDKEQFKINIRWFI